MVNRAAALWNVVPPERPPQPADPLINIASAYRDGHWYVVMFDQSPRQYRQAIAATVEWARNLALNFDLADASRMGNLITSIHFARPPTPD